jgi:hypothetical protein
MMRLAIASLIVAGLVVVASWAMLVKLNEAPTTLGQVGTLCATAPYVEAMVGRLKRDPEFYEESASTVSFS